MKKLLLALLILSLSISAQTRQTTLFSKYYAFVNLAQYKIEKDNETTIATVITFKNEEYKQIIDVKHIYAVKKEHLDSLIEKLSAALVFSKSGEKSDMMFEDDYLKFKITVNGNSNRFLLRSDIETTGYTIINYNNLSRIIEDLKLLKANYD